MRAQFGEQRQRHEHDLNDGRRSRGRGTHAGAAGGNVTITGVDRTVTRIHYGQRREAVGDQSNSAATRASFPSPAPVPRHDGRR